MGSPTVVEYGVPDSLKARSPVPIVTDVVLVRVVPVKFIW